MKSFSTFSAAAAILSGTADAFWRMECHSRSGLARLDPIVTPGKISSHAHAIHGGGNFGMSSSYEDLRASECTSCRATDDKSAYWTPALMFQHENGTTQVVKQVGGMLAYYLLFANEGETIETFPEGFRMLAGDMNLRNFTGPVPDPEKSLWTDEDKTQLLLGQKGIGMNCLNYGKDPEPSMYRHFMPDKQYLDDNCVDGIRAEIFFPSCWNGENDSDDHKSHVAYPDLVNGGKCPEGYEKRIPSLFFETIWQTYEFMGMPGTFMFANGDPTGYGYHGDFLNGWSTEILGSAIQQCTNPSGLLSDCPVFELQTEDEGSKCTFEMPEELSADNCEGPAPGLCGNVPVQFGPEYATGLLKPGETGAATAAPTTIATEDIVAVPTLSYTTAKSAVTDQFGGGISVLMEGQASLGADAPEPAPATPTPEVPAPVSETPVVDPAPVPTSPPAEASQPIPAGNIISTSIYTSAGTVYEIAIQQVQVTVTVNAPVAENTLAVEQPNPAILPRAAVHRRHSHHMHRRDREHGLLGRHF
ncbi:hypothetical protein GRF29_213g699842 [Pseudopithomyces chartarum]|uniref:DUF1996 domain-containing protein n=1 Tax=Pseudopithomyces chartarum TaxID=1892770 RepID=A0AAN6LMG4_9PLEO|nr:hypothetical protein GRF29_213g699842 [Pseudopithomyces chartarum]